MNPPINPYTGVPDSPGEGWRWLALGEKITEDTEISLGDGSWHKAAPIYVGRQLTDGPLSSVWVFRVPVRPRRAGRTRSLARRGRSAGSSAQTHY